MKYIGPHVSAAGGVQNAPLNARNINATAFGLFTKNQRQWKATPLTADTIDAFHKNMEVCGYSPCQVLPHDSYLINIGNPDSDKRNRATEALEDELYRCEQLGLPWLNIHPGSHLGIIDETECLSLIAQSINRIFDTIHTAGIVLETTAGQGTNVGYRFEHLAGIIDKVDDKSRIGVCIDTCHIVAAGYDIRDKSGFDSVMDEFEKVIGGDYIRGAHLNDIKSEPGSRVDRHESIGKGNMGLEPFRLLMNHRFFDNIPLILETIDDSLWPDEIAMLYDFECKQHDQE